MTSSVTKYLNESSTARDLLRSLALHGMNHWHAANKLFGGRTLIIYLTAAESLARVGLVHRLSWSVRDTQVTMLKLTTNGWLHLQRIDNVDHA